MKERIEKTTIKKVNLNDEDLEKIVGGQIVSGWINTSFWNFETLFGKRKHKR